MVDLEKVTRVEVIDENGRSYVNWNSRNEITTSLQDDGKTLKIFVKQGEVKETKPGLFLDTEAYKVIHDKDYPPEMFGMIKNTHIKIERRGRTREEIDAAVKFFTKQCLGY